MYTVEIAHKKISALMNWCGRKLKLIEIYRFNLDDMLYMLHISATKRSQALGFITYFFPS